MQGGRPGHCGLGSCSHLLYLSRAVLFLGPPLSLGRGRSPTLEAAPGSIGSLGPGPWRFDWACFDDMSVVTTAPALGVPGLFPGRVDGLHTHLIGQVSLRFHGHPRLTLCLSLEGDIRVLVLAPLALLEHIAAVIEVDVDEPLIHPLQGVLFEVPVGLVVSAPGDEGLGHYAPLL